MTDANYKAILEQAKADITRSREELAACRKREEELEQRVTRLKEIAVATAGMLGEDYQDELELGLTDAIRQVFKTSKTPLSYVNVGLRLPKIGFDLTRYGSSASATASIHTVISRLASKGEIKAAGDNAGKAFYTWIGDK
jgi:hypothetical protein